MAVVQRVNPALISPARLKATELTDSHTDSCGSLSTRTATSWTCDDWRDVAAHDAKPSSHLPESSWPEGCISGCFSGKPPFVCVLMSIWESCGGTAGCKMMAALQFCQDLSACLYLGGWWPRAKIGIRRCWLVCHSVWIDSGYVKKPLESAFVHEYQLCGPLLLSLWQTDEKLKRLVMARENKNEFTDL